MTPLGVLLLSSSAKMCLYLSLHREVVFEPPRTITDVTHVQIMRPGHRSTDHLMLYIFYYQALCKEYNAKIKLYTIRHAIVGQLREPTPGQFQSVSFPWNLLKFST